MASMPRMHVNVSVWKGWQPVTKTRPPQDYAPRLYVADGEVHIARRSVDDSTGRRSGTPTTSA